MCRRIEWPHRVGENGGQHCLVDEVCDGIFTADIPVSSFGRLHCAVQDFTCGDVDQSPGTLGQLFGHDVFEDDVPIPIESAFLLEGEFGWTV